MNQIKVFSTIHSITDRFRGILLDAYGVFWGGNSFGLLPGAIEAMEKLVSDGKIVGILTNSTHLALKEKEKLQKHGLIEGQHFHFLMSSGEIAKTVFREAALPFQTVNKRFFLVGSAHPHFSSHTTLFEETSYQETKQIDEADFLFLSIPHRDGIDQTNPDLFLQEVKACHTSKLPMVCVNPDRFAHEGNPPRAVVRQGSIAAMYEQLGGKVFYIGKPSALSFTSAMQYFYKYNLKPEDIMMVGDTPETDIRGAKSFGMASALITQTGIMSDRISQHGLEKVVHSLPSTDLPDFYIERLA